MYNDVCCKIFGEKRCRTLFPTNSCTDTSRSMAHKIVSWSRNLWSNIFHNNNNNSGRRGTESQKITITVPWSWSSGLSSSSKSTVTVIEIPLHYLSMFVSATLIGATIFFMWRSNRWNLRFKSKETKTKTVWKYKSNPLIRRRNERKSNNDNKTPVRCKEYKAKKGEGNDGDVVDYNKQVQQLRPVLQDLDKNREAKIQAFLEQDKASPKGPLQLTPEKLQTVRDNFRKIERVITE